MMEKICNNVDITPELKLDEIFEEVKEMPISPIYNCYGKIIHTGAKAEAGHYFSEMRLNVDLNQWYLFNDKEVKKTTDYSYIYQFEDLTPYMCLYKRKDK